MRRKIGSARDPKQTVSSVDHGGVSIWLYLELAHLSFIMIFTADTSSTKNSTAS